MSILKGSQLLEAGVAFVQDEDEIEGLAEGFIRPKKKVSLSRLPFTTQQSKAADDQEAFFCQRNKAAATDDEEAFFQSKRSRRVSVLVGSREAISKWLKLSASGRCALWVELCRPEAQGSLKASSKNSAAAAADHYKGMLKLAYRLRSQDALFFQPVLPEVVVNLSRIKPKTKSNKTLKKKQIHDDDDDDDEDDNYTAHLEWSRLRQKQRDKRQSSSQEEIGKPNWKAPLQWSLLISVDAFKHLIIMLFPGGVLWAFYCLLSQVIDLPQFLDVDFRHLDLPLWLAHHQYAVFVSGSDLVVAKTSSKDNGYVWTIFRFEFSKGIVLFAKGNNNHFRNLECNFGKVDKEQWPRRSDLLSQKKKQQQKKKKRKKQKHEEEVSKKKKVKETSSIEPEQPAVHVCSMLQWKPWGKASTQRDVLGTCLLDNILQYAFKCSEAEGTVAKSLTNQIKALDEEAYKCSLSVDLGTALRESKGSFASSSWKLSSKEQCALSHMRSSSRGIRCRGLRVFLDLMVNAAIDPSTRPKSGRSALPRKQARSTPATARLQGAAPSSEIENKTLLSGSMAAAMNRPPMEKQLTMEKDKRWVGSQTERTLRVAEKNWNQFEAMKSDCLLRSAGGRSNKKAHCQIEWRRVLEWLNNGFLELLLQEGILGSSLRGSSHPREDERAVFLDVQELSDVCLKVVEIVPGEGSCRLVKCLASIIENVNRTLIAMVVENPKFSGKSGLLEETPDLTRGHAKVRIVEETSQLEENSKEREKLQDMFQEMVWVCRLLPMLVSSSELVAAAFAKERGLTLILELYSSLVRAFPIGLKAVDKTLDGDEKVVILPGEVVKASQEIPLNVLRSLPCSQSVGNHHTVNISIERDSNVGQLSSIGITNLPCFKHEGSDLGPEFPMTALRSQQERSVHNTLSSRKRPSHVPQLSLSLLAVTSAEQEQRQVPQIKDGVCGSNVDTGLLSLSRTTAANMHLSVMTPNVFNIICETKLHLLRAIACMLACRSITIHRLRHRLTQKLNAKHGLILCFLPDLIGGPFSRFPACIGNKLKRMIFRVLFLLDKDDRAEEDDMFGFLHRSGSSCQVKDTPGVPWWSGPGPPPIIGDTKRGFSDTMLEEIQQRLDNILSTMSALLIGHAPPVNMECTSCEEEDSALTNDPRITRCHHSKTYVSRLWIDLAYLLTVLSEYVQYWPQQAGKVHEVVNSCGVQAECILSLLSGLGVTSSWGPAEILTMQSLLKLLSVCICNLVCGKMNSTQGWGDAEHCLWDVIFRNPANWNCLLQYVSYLTLDICQRCLGYLLEDFQRSLQGPIRLYYRVLGQKVGMGGISDHVFASFQGMEASPKNILGFLRLVVLLVQKRLDMAQESSCVSHVLDSLSLLEGIMNPSDGLLMMAVNRQAQAIPLQTKESEQKNSSATLHISRDQGKLHGNLCADTEKSGSDNGFQRDVRSFCPQCADLVLTGRNDSKIGDITHESLCLLAEIFSLKISSSSGQRLSSPKRCVQEKTTLHNPFLTSKYLDPILDTIFHGFKRLYTTTAPDESLLHESAAYVQNRRIHAEPSQGSNNKLWRNRGSNSRENEQKCNACATFARILLAVAQNQTGDASQTFHRLHVMEFLVQQIALEYEFSQVATPKTQDSMTGSSVERDSSKKEIQMAGNFRRMETQENCEWQLGSVSARDKTSLSPVIQPHQFSQLSSPQSREHEFISRWRKKHDGHDVQRSELPLCERDENISTLVSEWGDNCSIAVTQRSVTGTPRESRHTESKIHLQRFLTKLYNPALMSSGGLAGLATPRLNEVVYCGRFFDLNDEVERELAAEEDDFVSIDMSTSQLENFEDQRKHFKVTCAIEQTAKSSSHSSSLAPQSQSLEFVELEEEKPQRSQSPGQSSTTKPSTRPLVPKLNFSKAIRKGGLDFEEENVSSEPVASSNRDQCLPTTFASEGQRAHVEFNKSNPKLEGLFVSYTRERCSRRIYQNAGLHVLLLELFISLMLNPEYSPPPSTLSFSCIYVWLLLVKPIFKSLYVMTCRGSLEALYSDRFPMESRRLNAPFFLTFRILPHYCFGSVLLKQLGRSKPSAFRILKLTWRELFNESLYKERIRIAQGAFAQVYTATRDRIEDGLTSKELVVLKVVDLPKGPHDPCSFFDVYTEVQILEQFQEEPQVCQILDYGIDCNSFVLVLKHYKCSLRTWRHHHTCRSLVDEPDCTSTESKTESYSNLTFHERLPLYLEVYAAVLQAVKALETHKVVHYDLKCDNILLEPLHSPLSNTEFWHPPWPPSDKACSIPFRVCITDFGQSKTSLWEGGECTVRSRGTECVKSPEMLKLLSSSRHHDVESHKSRIVEEEVSVGKASDVWSLGCLLFELLTGEFLLYDEDWLRFYVRVTSSSERPTLDDVMACLAQLQAKLQEDSCIEELVCDIFEQLAETQGPSQKNNLMPETTPFINKSQDKKQVKFPEPEISKPRFSSRLWLSWNWYCCICCWRRNKHTH